MSQAVLCLRRHDVLFVKVPFSAGGILCLCFIGMVKTDTKKEPGNDVQ